MGNVKLYDKKLSRIIIMREGERNRENIFQYIMQNKTKGVTLREISENVNPSLSRQATNEHLRKLLGEKRIHKNNKRYFLTNSLYNNILVYARQMLDAQQDMIDMIEPKKTKMEIIDKIPKQELYQYPGFDPEIQFGLRKAKKYEPSPRNYLDRALYERTLSEYFCNTHFNKDSRYEKFLFECANRLGAYIIHIFIQALFPIIDSAKVDDDERKNLSTTLIDNAISLDDMFESFRYNLSKLGRISAKEMDYKEIFEFDKNVFNKVTTSFRNIYPNLYDAFENYWYNPRVFWLRLDTELAERSECSHQWESQYIFKFGKCLSCRKCHLCRMKK